MEIIPPNILESIERCDDCLKANFKYKVNKESRTDNSKWNYLEKVSSDLYVKVVNAILAELKAENSRKIIDARQPLKQQRKPGPRTTLLITVEDGATANMLCEKGLIFRYQNYSCFQFMPDAQVTRCCKCHRFGHRSKFCRAEETGGWCAATVDTPSGIEVAAIA